MDALATLLLFAFLFLCFLLFFPHHKLLPWFHSLLLPTASQPKPKPKHKLPKDSFKTEGDDKEDEANLKTVFATFDSDGDGFISRGELAESLERIGLAITGAEVGSMMASADANGDGLIDLGEFRELCLSWGGEWVGGEEMGEEEEDRELREVFRVFDGNGDGVITVEELGLVLKALGLKQGERAEACRDMIERVDLDGDGMVSFEEFKKMVKGGGKIF